MGLSLFLFYYEGQVWIKVSGRIVQKIMKFRNRENEFPSLFRNLRGGYFAKGSGGRSYASK
jgi:hypothetical protein